MTRDVVQAFWDDYVKTLPDGHPHHEATYSAWGFGDGAEMANTLGALVVEGRKTATASSLWSYEDSDEAEPSPGDLSIILDGSETPICIIQTTDVVVRPFNEVSAEFARLEGEGDLSLTFWREAHRSFFTREAERLQRTFDETMPVVCEQFKVIYTS